ncbi:MAG: SRPBCC family protein, partial [Aeromicrobium sp.]
MTFRRYLAGSAGIVYVSLQVLGRTAGSTASERRRWLPGDNLVGRPTMVTNHALTMAAPPDVVWPWLTQLGWHRAGWYTPRWVDRLLFPANWASLDELDPTLVRDLAVGDTIPDGPPDTAWYVVAEVEAPKTLVLRSTTHVPGAWRSRFGAGIDWTWAFVLSETPDGGTRIHLRVRGRTWPWWLTAAYGVTIVPADFVMAMG